MDRLLFSQDGETVSVNKQLNYYCEAYRPQLISQVLGFYQVVEEIGNATEKERTLRNLFSHPKLTDTKTIQAAKNYFGSEDLQKAGRNKIDEALEELEGHARRIISEKLGIQHEPIKFYKTSRNVTK